MTKHEGSPSVKEPAAEPESPGGTRPSARGLSGIALVVVLTGYA
ncbi:hypothetical protein [Streptomyces sp. NPDC058045]